MSILTSLGVILLASFIGAFLQFPSGVFLLLRHYASAKLSKKKTRSLSGAFSFGAATGALLFFILAFLLIRWTISASLLENPVFEWCIAGVMILYGVLSWFFYYRANSEGTELYISRNTASALCIAAKKTKDWPNAFMLGMTSTICEIPFSLPLFCIVALELNSYSTDFVMQISCILVFLCAMMLPILTSRFQFFNDGNLATIQRKRVKAKSFVRVILSLGFFLIATIIICFRILK